jgi:hypothetical protein
MLFLVVEHFRNADPRPVYARFAAEGRMAPEGVQYVTSWTTTDLSRCYQVMACASRAALDEWISHWSDLVDFEVHDVMTSPAAALAVAALPPVVP